MLNSRLILNLNRQFMIKYEVKTGNKAINERARTQRDLVYKPQLKGMNCRVCRADTIISFEEREYGIVVPLIDACCSDFDQRIRERLQIKG